MIADSSRNYIPIILIGGVISTHQSLQLRELAVALDLPEGVYQRAMQGE